ncbi:hypothetical protein GCM10023194_56760 [Planotetraspora phitsanulokensis]|uniref:Uncharacterized protein n=1 Tax=Planotetraspora phitsanulokensis TaxID=575192 RepID=A0A8J3UCM9_9ACTN|nr:hypothetical protein Pph01_80360 [Planotetraspora phitsanulokensis]
MCELTRNYREDGHPEVIVIRNALVAMLAVMAGLVAYAYWLAIVSRRDARRAPWHATEMSLPPKYR